MGDNANWTAPNKPKNNSTNSNANSTGGGTKPTPTLAKPTPPKKLTNVKVECPPTNKTIYPCFDFIYSRPTVNIDYGVFVLKINKTINARYKLNTTEQNKIATVGLTTGTKPSLNFNVVIDSSEDLKLNFGGEVSVGNWLSVVFKLNTTVGFTKWSLVYTHQTINVFANDFVKLKATTKVNDYIFIEDTFEVALNKYLAAVLVYGVIVSLPVTGPAIAAGATAIARWLASGGFSYAPA